VEVVVVEVVEVVVVPRRGTVGRRTWW
jgi:hypothetical protein